MAAIAISVRSTGSWVGTSMWVNGVDIASGRYGRGLNVAVLDQSTGAVLWFQVFDTYDSARAADEFAAAIERLPIGRVVLVAVGDEASASLTDRARHAAETLGSQKIFDLGYRNAWALVGQKGAPPGSQAEQMSADRQVMVTSQFEPRPADDGGLALRAASAGFSVGNAATLSVNGATVMVTGRGMNVAVIDENTGHVLQTETFDTYESPEASDRFAALLEGLPPGRIAMIAVKDEATASLTERAKLACEAMGSARIRDLAYRGSWALVGVKASIPGTACEILANSAPACACTWLQPTRSSLNYVTVSIQSAGYDLGNMAAIFIDDIAVLPASAAHRGYNVAVVSPDDGVVQRTASFDLNGDRAQADELAKFIDAVPRGWLVPMAVADEGSVNLNDNARRALRSIGSALIGNLGYRNSYALLGVKGAAPGVVPEMLMPASACASSFRHPLSPALPFHDVECYSAGYAVGNTATIWVDGQAVDMPNGYGRGLNVVVLGRDGTIELARTFDTNADASASEAFAALVEQAQAGQVFAIAVKDEATEHLTDRARQACGLLGGIGIGQLRYRGSWAMVGAKGRLPGTAAEVVSDSTAARAGTSYLSRVEDDRGFWVGAQSAGYDVGNYARITRNGGGVGPQGRGLNVAVFDEATGDVLLSKTYDTYASSTAADEFAAMVEALPPGRIVAVAVMDEASQSLTDRARRACETLGSAYADQLSYRNSWSLIGVKGTAPGSAVEVLAATTPAGVQTWIGYFTADGARAEAIGALFAAFLVIVAVAVVALVVEVIVTSLRPAPTPLPPVPPQRVRRRGVFVGIDYTNVPGLNLNGLPSRIIGDFRRGLVNLGLFEDADTILLTEQEAPGRTPSRANVVAALQWLIKDAKAGDVLYFHYLGHGGRNTTVNPPYEYLITLNGALTGRDVLKEADLQALLNTAPPDVNLSCAFHCCFSGDLIDNGPNGRGIGMASSLQTAPSHLKQSGANFTGAIGVKMKNAVVGKVPWPTYEQVRQFIEQQPLPDHPTLSANPALYNVQTLKFIEPLPSSATPEVIDLDTERQPADRVEP